MRIVQPVSGKRLAILSRRAARFDIEIDSLCLLGDNEQAVTRNLLRLALGARSVRIKDQRLTITANGHAIRILRCIVQAAKSRSIQKRNMTRLITALIHAVPVGRPSKITKEICERVTALHKERKSQRFISRQVGISRATVAKVLELSAARAGASHG